MTHVCDHSDHVVVGGMDERRAEHDGQVARFHFVHAAVLDDFLKMH